MQPRLDTGFDIRAEGGCACGGGCPACAAAGRSGLFDLQAGIGAPGAILGPRRDAGNQVTSALIQHLRTATERVPAEPAPAIAPPPIVSGVFGAPGAPLPADVAASAGRLLGADLTHVRVHTGPDAATAAAELGADAYTFGADIGFRAGAFTPGTPADDRLLLHELAHVVQQTRRGRAGSTARRAADHEAHAAAGRAGPVRLATPRRLALQRSAAARGFAAQAPTMQAAVDQLIASLPAATQQQIHGRDTIVVGLVQEQGGGIRTLVYTVAGNRTYPGLEEAAARLGMVRWSATPRAEGRGAVGAPSDAEQILFEAADAQDFQVRALAASRDFCADCVEAIRAELGPGSIAGGPRGGGGPTGGGGARGGAARAQTPEELVGGPGRAQAQGAVAGAALMIHQAQVASLQQAEYERAMDAIEAMRPQIDGLRAQGNWVAIIVVVSAPVSVDLLRGVFTEPSQITRFSHISLTYGSTREEAINPPLRFEAAPPGRPSMRPPDPGPNRRFQSQIAEVRPPLRRHQPEATGPVTLRNPELIERYALALATIRRDPSAARAQPSIISSNFAPYNLDNPAIQADLRALVAAMPPTEQEFVLLTIALGPWLVQRAPSAP
jgi:hypothetical protein